MRPSRCAVSSRSYQVSSCRTMLPLSKYRALPWVRKDSICTTGQRGQPFGAPDTLPRLTPRPARSPFHAAASGAAVRQAPVRPSAKCAAGAAAKKPFERKRRRIVCACMPAGASASGRPSVAAPTRPVPATPAEAETHTPVGEITSHTPRRRTKRQSPRALELIASADHVVEQPREIAAQDRLDARIAVAALREQEGQGLQPARRVEVGHEGHRIVALARRRDAALAPLVHFLLQFLAEFRVELHLRTEAIGADADVVLAAHFHGVFDV